MYEWLTEGEPEFRKSGNGKAPGLDRVRLERKSLDPIDFLSASAVFFIAGNAIQEEVMLVNLHIRKPSTRKMVMEEIAPHFEDVKQIYVDGQEESVNLLILRNRSKELFLRNQSPMMALARDLYRVKDISMWRHAGRRELQTYTVIPEKLQKANIPESDDLRQLIAEEYLEPKELLAFVPTGWAFADELRNSLFLRYFSAFVPRVNLVVDSNRNEVILVELTS
jgi:hypothetical protein